jgi:DNA polymerase V
MVGERRAYCAGAAGVACVELAPDPVPKKEIACTRSFGHPVLQLYELTEAVTEFACRAAEKLRSQGSHTGQVLCFVRTSPFRVKDKQYSRSIIVPLRKATADSAYITQAAVTGLRAIYQPGYKYAKAGIMLLDLQDEQQGQVELDLDADLQDRSLLMSAMDQLNLRYGRGTLALGSAHLGTTPSQWTMKQERRTPRYTTQWNDMMVARAI